MSGGSQHNPNGRQSQLGPGWSPLQMASYLARAPQAHMAERGVSWHTPTPPPHLYHMPTSSSPDPLQAMKAVAGSGNSVFRHTATPPDLFRHTPTPPDKHLLSRHTPSPGDPKAGVSITPAELYPHLGPSRDKLVRPEDLLYGRAGVDLSVSRSTNANGAPMSLSVRDAPTINSLIARAAPRRVDSLLERLAPSPSPSVIVHPKPPTSSASSADDEESQAPKRKRKAEKTLRLTIPNGKQDHATNSSRRKTDSESSETIDEIAAMIAADDGHDDKEKMEVDIPTAQEAPVTVDKLKSVLASPNSDVATEIPPKNTDNSDEKSKNDDKHEKLTDLNKNPAESPMRDDNLNKSETNPQNPDKINENTIETNTKPATPPHAAETESVKPPTKAERKKSPKKMDETTETEVTAAAPKRRSARLSDSTNIPIESPSEGKPAETVDRTPAPTTAFVEVETELAKMFAGIEDPLKPETPAKAEETASNVQCTKTAKKRRKSVASKGERKARRPSRAMTEESVKKKPSRKRPVVVKQKKDKVVKDGCDSGSNASSSRSRGPYIQIRGPRESPVSVSVKNASTADEESEHKRGGEFRNGHRVRGLHTSTLGLRYDAASRDLTWLCVFCGKQPHADRLGDLFGPYTMDNAEAWMHEDCAVWAPGLVGAGPRLWGLEEAVNISRATLCSVCKSPGAGIACAARVCQKRSHVPCARNCNWSLDIAEFKALCPLHRHQ